MHLKSVIVTIATAMILTLMLQYANVMTVMRMTERNTQRVMNDYITTNEIKIYNSMKKSRDFTDSTHPDIIIDAFSEECSYNENSGSFYRTNEDGDIIFEISGMNTTLTATHNELNVETTYTISFPLNFIDKHISIDVPMNITSTHQLIT